MTICHSDESIGLICLEDIGHLAALIRQIRWTEKVFFGCGLRGMKLLSVSTAMLICLELTARYSAFVSLNDSRGSHRMETN